MFRCVKEVLKLLLNERILNQETFQSLVIQAENMINSRPLTEVPLDNEISESLTPNHLR